MSFIKFGHPQYLHFLWGIPALALLYIFAFRKKRAAYARFSSVHLFKRLTTVNFQRQQVKALLVIFGYTFLAFALARPQFGVQMAPAKRRGLDIIIALDTSLSMQAEDIKPNRFEKAKHEIKTLIDKLENDRVGIIAFAGASFVQCPLTTDYGAVRMFLDILDTDIIPHPGTAIGNAIRRAIKTFRNKEYKYKVLILVTDGEDHDSDPISAAKIAAQAGIKIYALGLGIPRQGAPIPLYDNGKLIGYKCAEPSRESGSDSAGEAVLTRLNETILRRMVRLTGGQYYLASVKEQEIDKLYKSISSLERRELEQRQFTQYAEGFQFFLVIALILLVGELIWLFF